ncbi:hypothetical protein LTR17_021328 [Elasticomyces elasticus]|nr:hypothetical protein LTR17_021328 [Elasticomyces elasticus]
MSFDIAEPRPDVYHSSHGSIQPRVEQIARADGNHLYLSDGRKIFDAVGGAAATSIGHGDKRVKKAICNQLDTVEYCRSTLFRTSASRDLSQKLVASTQGRMKRVVIVNSGSEAVDAALKLSILYFHSIGQSERVRFIARESSYHGSSVAALSLGYHKRRRELYQGILGHDGVNFSHVSRAFAYRDQKAGQTEEQYVEQLVKELDNEFQAVGPDTVCAFVAKTVVGAGLAAVVPPKGYFVAMKQVCDKYGALLMLDEVMCGLGRTGTYHAWQHPEIGVTPDLQTVGKTLAGGYVPIAALLIGTKVAKSMEEQGEFFVHGSTYEDHPVASAAAFTVKTVIRQEGLVDNVRLRGEELVSGLSVELAQPGKPTPYPSDMKLAYRVRDAGLKLPPKVRESLGIDGVSLFPMQGGADGMEGDVIMIMPAYDVTSQDIETIVEAFATIVECVVGKSGELFAYEFLHR